MCSKARVPRAHFCSSLFNDVYHSIHTVGVAVAKMSLHLRQTQCAGESRPFHWHRQTIKTIISITRTTHLPNEIINGAAVAKYAKYTTQKTPAKYVFNENRLLWLNIRYLFILMHVHRCVRTSVLFQAGARCCWQMSKMSWMHIGHCNVLNAFQHWSHWQTRFRPQFQSTETVSEEMANSVHKFTKKMVCCNVRCCLIQSISVEMRVFDACTQFVAKEIIWSDVPHWSDHQLRHRNHSSDGRRWCERAIMRAASLLLAPSASPFPFTIIG